MKVKLMVVENCIVLTSTLDDHAISVFQNGKLNLTSQCNQNCFCSTFAYTPVCMEETSETFFNPCVAGCNKYSKKEKVKLNFNNLFSFLVSLK
jgi:hypothetical protein